MKEVILTGGTKGIGLSILDHLVKDSDYSIHVVSKDTDRIKCLQKTYEKVHFHKVDLSSKIEVSEFCQRIGKLNIYGIINNAGICQTAPIGTESISLFEKVLAINLSAPFLLIDLLIHQVQNNGRIINISSQLGLEGRANYGAYCASKFGIIGLTKCWAKELGFRGITVNAICPGWVDTEMSRIDLTRLAQEKSVSIEDFYDKISQPLELKRFTKPEEVANLAIFLLSDKAGGITGRDWLLTTIWNQE